MAKEDESCGGKQIKSFSLKYLLVCICVPHLPLCVCFFLNVLTSECHFNHCISLLLKTVLSFCLP